MSRSFFSFCCIIKKKVVYFYRTGVMNDDDI